MDSYGWVTKCYQWLWMQWLWMITDGYGWLLNVITGYGWSLSMVMDERYVWLQMVMGGY